MATVVPDHRPRKTGSANRRPRRHPDETLSASISDVAAEFGVCEKTVRRWLADGRIRGQRVGPRLLRFSLAQVREDLGAA